MSYLRTDLRWEWFESNYDEDWNSAKISYWRSVIGLGKSRGIEIIPILHGRPLWIEPTAPDIFVQFGDFCTKIAEEFGTSIYY